MFQKTFPFSVRCNAKYSSMVSAQILAKIYRVLLKECAYHKISSIMTKTSGNCFYIVNIYFLGHFVNVFGLAVLSYRPSSFDFML